MTDIYFYKNPNSSYIKELPSSAQNKIILHHQPTKKPSIITKSIYDQKICNIALNLSEFQLLAKLQKKKLDYYFKEPILSYYSPKFSEILKLIKTSSGPIFIYTNFLDHGTTELSQLFLSNGYHKFSTKNEKKNTFAILTGSDTKSYKQMVIDLYNSKNNRHGNIIKILIGSRTLKEGVNLLRTNQVHLLDPYWNESQSEQAIGRAIRFCSHKDMPEIKGEKPFVSVYRYIMQSNVGKTADITMKERSIQKSLNVNFANRKLKEIAIDCILNKNVNEADLICVT
jgi:superfamily II DNA or RNA helicase